jgi:hypothetical protein
MYSLTIPELQQLLEEQEQLQLEHKLMLDQQQLQQQGLQQWRQQQLVQQPLQQQVLRAPAAPWVLVRNLTCFSLKIFGSFCSWFWFGVIRFTFYNVWIFFLNLG